MATERWNTTVTELMLLFRDALIALVPVLDRAHIPWRDGEDYDQWMYITWTLYEQIVVDAIAYPLSARGEYVQVEKSGRGGNADFVAVEPTGARPDEVLIFAEFSTDDPPFAQAICWRRTPEKRAERFDVDQCEFSFMHTRADGTVERITQLAIDD